MYINNLTYLTDVEEKGKRVKEGRQRRVPTVTIHDEENLNLITYHQKG